jgi:hypothetical protein
MIMDELMATALRKWWIGSQRGTMAIVEAISIADVTTISLRLNR